MKKYLKISVSIIVLIVISLGIYSFSKKVQKPIENNKVIQGVNQEIEKNDRSNWETYTNADYGFTLRYPNSWNIKTTKPSDMGGKWFSVEPEKVVDNGKLRFTIAIFEQSLNSEIDPKSWYKNNIEDIDRNPEYKGITKNLEINGNPAYYVKSPENVNNGQSYLQHSYVISHGKSVLLVLFGEKESIYDSGKNLQNEWNYSTYLADFEYLVNSIGFTN